MILVIVESPFAGKGSTPEERDHDAAENLRYARACLADCLSRGEAPFASHLLYTQPGVLDDDVPAERARGIEAGFSWRRHSSITALYVDRGVSRGMLMGKAHAIEMIHEGYAGHKVEERRVPGWADRPIT